MKKRLTLRHLLGGTVLVSLMFFQNCGDPAMEEDSNSAASYMEELPFAYKASLDTIAYMSCSRMKNNYESRAFFTFRAGAYTPMGGLEVTEEFAEATKYYSLQTKREAFSQSLKNSNTRPQLAIRSTSNLQHIVINGTTKNGTSLGTMLTNLSKEPVVNHLITMRPGAKKHYFPSGEKDRLLASSLRFNDGDEDNVVGKIRTLMKDNDVLLGLTFTDQDVPDDALARGPSGISGDSVYGRGYQLQFSNPAGWATAEQRVISSVNEVNLSQGFPSVGSKWSCPSSMQFVVIRNEDLPKMKECPADPCSGSGVCLTPDFYCQGNETQRLALDAIRRVLPVEDFYVDVINRVVVAKPHISNQSCYGDRTGRGDVNYSSGSCSGDSCPHYVSVCIKTQ